MPDVDLKLNQAALDKLLESPQGEVGQFLEKKGQESEQTAKRLVPYDSGELQRSIGHKVDKDSQGLLMALYATAPYALIVETGGRRQDPQPFLRPAISR